MMLSNPFTMCELAIAATETDDSECALLALQILNKRPTGKPSQAFTLDEGSITAILGTAARTGNAALAKEAWDLLKIYLNSVRTPSPAAYGALLHAWSSSGDFEAAFSTLHEMQILFGNPQTAEESEVLSPFTSLRPLVVALSRAGPTGLDAVSFLFAVIIVI
jgi:pentatricopeptide repeat protein